MRPPCCLNFVSRLNHSCIWPHPSTLFFYFPNVFSSLARALFASASRERGFHTHVRRVESALLRFAGEFAFAVGGCDLIAGVVKNAFDDAPSAVDLGIGALIAGTVLI